MVKIRILKFTDPENYLNSNQKCYYVRKIEYTSFLILKSLQAFL